MYKTKVISIGDDAIYEESGMLILFHNECPDELRDACVIHEPQQPITEDVLHTGVRVQIDQQDYVIEQVGSVANKNFAQLGHITMVFGPADKALAGAIVLSPAVFPKVSVDTTITFH